MMVRDIMMVLIGMVIVQSSLTYLHCFFCADRFFIWKGGENGNQESLNK